MHKIVLYQLDISSFSSPHYRQRSRGPFSLSHAQKWPHRRNITLLNTFTGLQIICCSVENNLICGLEKCAKNGMMVDAIKMWTAVNYIKFTQIGCYPQLDSLLVICGWYKWFMGIISRNREWSDRSFSMMEETRILAIQLIKCMSWMAIISFFKETFFIHYCSSDTNSHRMLLKCNISLIALTPCFGILPKVDILLWMLDAYFEIIATILDECFI